MGLEHPPRSRRVVGSNPILDSDFFFPSPHQINIMLLLFHLQYRVFSLTWPASMQIYWNKRKRLHKKRVQLPEDWFGTPTWPPFHCFGTPIWPPWRQVKTLYNRKNMFLFYCKLLNYFPRGQSNSVQTSSVIEDQRTLNLIQWIHELSEFIGHLIIYYQLNHWKLIQLIKHNQTQSTGLCLI